VSSSPALERTGESCQSGKTTQPTPGSRGGGLPLLLDTLHSNWVSAAVWVVGGGAANVAMAIGLKREMDGFPGGAAGLAASILPAAEAMRPLRWPAERLDTLGGYITYHNLTLFALFLAIYGAMQGARAIRGGEENHSLEQVLATGWSRWGVVRDRALGFAVTMAAVSIGLGLGIAAGLGAAGEPNLCGSLASFLAIGLCALVGYGLGLLISQFTTSRRAAAGVSAAVLTTLYVIENTWENLHGFGFLRFLSPFHYANLSRALVPGRDFDPAASATLLAMAAGLVLAGGCAFQRRDYRAPLWRWPLRSARPSMAVRAVFAGGASAGPDLATPRASGLAPASPGTRVLSRWLLRSAWSALVVRGRYGLLAWSAAAAMFTGLLMFLEPPVMDVWSWFATYIPGGGGLTGASAETQYVSFTTQIVIPFVAGYVITQASGWTADLAQGRVELVLATPLSRSRLVAERLLSVVVGTAGVALGAIVGLYVGASAVGLSLQGPGLVRTAAGSLILGAALGGVAVLVVAAFRGSLAVTVMAVLMGSSYLVGYLAELFRWPAWAGRFSVFTVFGRPYVEWPTATDSAVLASVTVVGTGLAMFVAERTRSVA